MNNLLINDVETKIRIYLETIHPSNSNSFIIRLGDCINTIYERRRSYIVKFPLINQEIIDQIIDKWTNYALENIIENYDINKELTIISIDPLKFPIEQLDININYTGQTINPEFIIKNLCVDIIEQLNKHLIELYMDENYPHIDIDDQSDREKFNEIFDQLNMIDIYNKYPNVDIYIELNLKTNIDDVKFYINGTINTQSNIIDIVDDIRNCLDTNDTQESITYDKHDIIYKFGSDKILQNFSIITDPKI